MYAAGARASDDNGSWDGMGWDGSGRTRRARAGGRATRATRCIKIARPAAEKLNYRWRGVACADRHGTSLTRVEACQIIPLPVHSLPPSHPLFSEHPASLHPQAMHRIWAGACNVTRRCVCVCAHLRLLVNNWMYTFRARRSEVDPRAREGREEGDGRLPVTTPVDDDADGDSD